MEFEWKIDLPEAGKMTESQPIEACNRMFRLRITHVDPKKLEPIKKMEDKEVEVRDKEVEQSDKASGLKECYDHRVLLTVIYLGSSYTDIITELSFTINGTKKLIPFTFSRFESYFTFPILQSEIYNLRLIFSVASPPYNSKKATNFSGLRNLGATCYMNSYLQTLFHIKRFTNELFLLAPSKKTFQLQKLFYKLLLDNDVDTRSFADACKWFSDVNAHQDVDEYGKLLFDVLENENKKKPSKQPESDKDTNNNKTHSDENNNKTHSDENNNKTHVDENNNKSHIDENNNKTHSDEVSSTTFFVDELFMGKLCNYIRCDCKCERRIEEDYSEIQLELRDWMNNKVSSNIKEGFKNVVKEERLEGDNKYRCEEHGLVNATKGTEIIKVPPILRVLLKRFTVDYSTGESKKINDIFEFYDRITLNDICGTARNGDDNDTVYRLYGVIVHAGMSNDGHYYTYLNINGWYKFNDSVVTKVSEEESLYYNFGGFEPFLGSDKNHSAYILLYVKEKEYENLILEEVKISNFLENKIYDSESGKSVKINYMTRNTLSYHTGPGIPIEAGNNNANLVDENNNDITTNTVSSLSNTFTSCVVRSDDPLFVLGKNSFKRNFYIFDTKNFELFDNEECVNENLNYFLYETNKKRKKEDILVITKRYKKRKECFKDDFIDLKITNVTFVSKNMKLQEFVDKVSGNDEKIYHEELVKQQCAKEDECARSEGAKEGECAQEGGGESVKEGEGECAKDNECAQDSERKGEDECNQQLNTAADNVPGSINNDCNNTVISVASTFDTDKNISDLIEENTKKEESDTFWSVKKADLNLSFCENGIKNGSILIFAENDDFFIEDYQKCISSIPITFITNKENTFYIQKNTNYENLLKITRNIFMNNEIEIPCFKNTIEFNNLKSIKISMKNCKNILFGCGLQKCYHKNGSNAACVKEYNGRIVDSSKIEKHDLICNSLKVKNLYKKISNLNCVKNNLVYKNDEFYKKDGIKEEIKVYKEDFTFNKKVYDTLKEDCTIVEMFKGNPYYKKYNITDEIIGDGLILLKEKNNEMEICMMNFNGNFEGYPILVQVKKGDTLNTLRNNQNLYMKICKFDGDKFKEITEDERLDKLEKNDVLVICNGKWPIHDA